MLILKTSAGENTTLREGGGLPLFVITRLVLVIHHDDSQLVPWFRMAPIGRWIARTGSCNDGIVSSELHPENNHVKPKIRQQLQVLRDAGVLEFVSRGKYRVV